MPGEGSRAALLVDAIQTDTSINPGSSGGALVDCEGGLISVPTADATVRNAAGEASGQRRHHEGCRRDHRHQGRSSAATSGHATPAQGADGTPSGLRVSAVEPSNRRTVESFFQLLALTLTRRAGSMREMKIEREGVPHTLTLTLGKPK